MKWKSYNWNENIFGRWQNVQEVWNSIYNYDEFLETNYLVMNYSERYKYHSFYVLNLACIKITNAALIHITLFWRNMYELKNVEQCKGNWIDDTLCYLFHETFKVLANIQRHDCHNTLVVNYLQFSINAILDQI